MSGSTKLGGTDSSMAATSANTRKLHLSRSNFEITGCPPSVINDTLKYICSMPILGHSING